MPIVTIASLCSMSTRLLPRWLKRNALDFDSAHVCVSRSSHTQRYGFIFLSSGIISYKQAKSSMATFFSLTFVGFLFECCSSSYVFASHFIHFLFCFFFFFAISCFFLYTFCRRSYCFCVACTKKKKKLRLTNRQYMMYTIHFTGSRTQFYNRFSTRPCSFQIFSLSLPLRFAFIYCQDQRRRIRISASKRTKQLEKICEVCVDQQCFSFLLWICCCFIYLNHGL